MAKKKSKKKGRKGTGGRVTPKGTRPPGSGHLRGLDPLDPLNPLDSPPGLSLGSGPWDPFGPEGGWDPFDPPDEAASALDGAEFDLAAALADAADADEPLELLSVASLMLNTMDPRTIDPFSRRGAEPEGPTLADVVQSLGETERPEVDALLAVFAELTSDRLLARRIDKLLEPRRPRHPAWLGQLAAAEVHTVVEQSHVLGDGDDIFVGLRLGDHDLTAIVYIDHNLGTVVKDAFVIPEHPRRLIALMREQIDEDDHFTWRDLGPADARARIEEAIRVGAITVPPFESDTWPVCRPLVEWTARLLPEGGHGYERPDWPDARRAELTERFFASEEGAPVDDEDHRGLFETLLWFGADYGPGDPLRWSGSTVEILLADWLPRKVVADAAYLSKAPDLLRAFIRFCHRERAIAADLTEDTLAAVDHFEPEYQQTIRSVRPQGPAALVARLFEHGPRNFDDPTLDALVADLAGGRRGRLEAAVGGAEVLAALTDEPLPDEAFDWSTIEPDISERVGEVIEFGDAFADAHFDAEFRTATRRLLARIAGAAPEVFRRKGAASSAAAAVAWLVARDNELLYPSPGAMTAQDLVAAFGRSGSVSTRAGTMVRNAGLGTDASRFHCPPDLLVSARRRAIIDQRDGIDRQLALGGGPGAGQGVGAGLGLAGRGPAGAERPTRRRAPADRRPARSTVHRLKVTLSGVRPPIWRRLEVPSDATLADLHQILQLAFGWFDEHLHAFEVGAERFAPGPDSEFGGFGGPQFGFGLDVEEADEATVTLSELVAAGDRFTYTYDFGDDWDHRIEVEAVEDRQAGAQYPACTAGRRSGPPEDVGGAWGYAEFLDAMADPNHPEHDQYVEWQGPTWDADAFDRADLDEALHQLQRFSSGGR